MLNMKVSNTFAPTGNSTFTLNGRFMHIWSHVYTQYELFLTKFKLCTCTQFQFLLNIYLLVHSFSSSPNTSLHVHRFSPSLSTNLHVQFDVRLFLGNTQMQCRNVPLPMIGLIQ